MFSIETNLLMIRETKKNINKFTTILVHKYKEREFRRVQMILWVFIEKIRKHCSTKTFAFLLSRENFLSGKLFTRKKPDIGFDNIC